MLSVRRLAPLVAAVLLMTAVGVVGAPAASATTSPPALSSINAPLPPDTIANSPARLAAVSCGSPGSCVAVGSYTTSIAARPLIETLSGGNWSASTVPNPSSGTVTHPAADLTQVSCASGGTCVALGTYNSIDPFAATLVGGTWIAADLPIPTDQTAGTGANFTSVGCDATGNCVVVGTYTYAVPGGYNADGSFVDTMRPSGTTPVWHSVRAPVPANATTLPNGSNAPVAAQLLSVSCSGADSCVAVGSYYADQSSAFQGLIETIAGGTPNPAQVQPLPGGINNNWWAQLQHIGCGGGECVATGIFGYTGQSGRLLETWSNGGATPSIAPLPADAAGGAGLRAVSCGGSALCATGGQYAQVSGSGAVSEPLLDTGTAGGWASQEAPLPSGRAPQESVGAVSCLGSDTCAAITVDQGSSPPSPSDVVDTLTDGTWTGHLVPTPDGTGTTGGLLDVSCDASQHCFAVTDGGLIVTIGAPVTPADTSAPTVTITSHPAANTSATSASVAFTVSDPDNAVGTLTVTCSLDGGTPAPCTSPHTVTGLAQGVHTLTLRASDPAANTGAPVSTTWRVDTTHPTAVLTAPTAAFTLAGATVSWAGSDVGSGVASYRLRARSAPYNGGFPTAWSTPTAWASLPASVTHVVAGLSVGNDTCFEVQAVDKAGSVSPWSAQRCTERPLDDYSLVASSGWARVHSTLFYLGTYTGTTHLGATLTRTGAQLDRIAVVATRCPTCGIVAVYAGTTLIGKVNLSWSTTIRRAVFVLPAFSLRSATIRIRVLTSGKVIQIDGLGTSRT